MERIAYENKILGDKLLHRSSVLSKNKLIANYQDQKRYKSLISKSGFLSKSKANKLPPITDRSTSTKRAKSTSNKKVD